MMLVRPLPYIGTAQELLRQLAASRSTVGPQPVDKPLVLYGAGKLGRMAGHLFARLGIPVIYAVDRACHPSDRLLNGIPVIRPEVADPGDRETCLLAVCVVTAAYEPIRAALSAMGWRHIFPVYDILESYRDRLPLSNGWFANDLSDDEVDKIGAVLAGWSDDWSRAAHLQFLAWRLHREEWQFSEAPVCVEDRYFIDPVRRVLRSSERFLDAGAHHGQVIARWLELVGNQCGAIMAVEPDRENVAQLKRWAATLPQMIRDHMVIRECALASETGRKPYSHGWDFSSRLAVSADGEASTLRIDDLDFPLTFGKIHVEGGELDALHGGVETIRRYRPILAVTTYHNADGVWRIPHFLMETLSDYQYFMRLHGWCGTGAVVYAVPNERGCVA
ncbi:MAG: FkbM family methyltransferase [Nitrospira sp.]|nr:FkbM family methyltransferase [Nitrospira sp.]MCP9442241.1 FkbM family methyltransferase [Nitrospira sp.]